jgi:hypothetical protein
MSEALQKVGAPAVERAEVDRPNNALIFTLVVVTLTALVGIVAGVNELFKATIQREISAKVLEPQSTSLRGLRAEERRRLSQYQWVSEKDGVVRIPRARAVELTLKDYREKRASRVERAPEAAPESASPRGPAPAVETKK